jgi:hypothetical protein
MMGAAQVRQLQQLRTLQDAAPRLLWYIVQSHTNNYSQRLSQNLPGSTMHNCP